MDYTNMTALIYCERGNLFIRKPNGLEYTFENVDAPVLGFDFEVLIYDEIKTKITNWQIDKPFEEQERIPLSDDECSMIEGYIENSEPPEGVTLQTQYIDNLERYVHHKIFELMNQYGFCEISDVVAAGREGSNHPWRSSARRVLEFYDNLWFIYDQLCDEIKATREDHLQPYSSYENKIPFGQPSPDMNDRM
jgi:hypothetical protein